jgi:ABC-type transport system involved in multi-copper enzyme maturation permease subunit
MKALFLKEWRQNYLLFLFALIMAGFLPGMYALIHGTWVRDWRDQETLNEIVGVAYVVVQFIIVLFAGAGLFAGETERGTLPVLLGLPLSRGQVWLAKLAAGLTLALSGVAVVMGTGLMVLPQTISQLAWHTMWRDLPLCLTLAFLGAFFLSAVLNRTISALLATIVFGIALFVAVVLFMDFLGAALLGYDPAVDIYLWMVSVVPAMLLASYVAFARGAMAGGRRKWWLALVTLAAGVLVTDSLIIEVARWETRYQRSRVEWIAVEAATPGGATIGLFTEGDLAGPPFRVEGGTKISNTNYRRQHVALVNLQDGRELLTRRGDSLVAVSKDGKVAAISTGWPTLTWRTSDLDSYEMRGVEIWDLARHRRLYRGFPSKFWEKGKVDPRRMEWSPDGEWLLMVAYGAWSYYGVQSDGYPNGPSEIAPFDDHDKVLLLMRRDGSAPKVIECHGDATYGEPAYAWDLRSGRHGVYVFGRDGSLVRHDLETGKAEKVWAGPVPAAGARFWLQQASIASSPDGQTLAVAVVRTSSGPAAQPKELLLFTLPSGGGVPSWARATLVATWDASLDADTWGNPQVSIDNPGPLLAWSDDGRALCAAAVGFRRSQEWLLWTARWQRGSAAALAPRHEVAADIWVDGLVAIPHTGRFLLWGSDEARLVDEDAQLQPLPGSLLALRYGPVVFDNQGRAIIKVSGEKSKLAALDITTGKVTDIYP